MPSAESVRTSETRLIANLREQHDLHQRLLGELEAKREALRTADMQRVFEISEREQRIVSRMTQLEHVRLDLISELAPQRSHGDKPPTLSTLLPHLSPKARAEVEAIQASLRDRVLKVRELSAVIKAAGEALHQHISGVVQSMQRVFSDAGIYERRGVVATSHRVVSTIDLRS